MKKSLLVTTAAAAVIACMSLAQAQTGGGDHGGMTGGGMNNAQSPNTGPAGGGGNMSNAPAGAVHSSVPDQNNQAQDVTPSQNSNQQLGQDQNGQPPNGKGHGLSQRNDEKQHGASNNDKQPGGVQNNQAQKNDEQNGTNEHLGQNGSRGGGVQLSADQRTRIQHDILRNKHVARIDHPDFSVSVGVTIPRSVHVAVLPAEIVTFVPQYRGFDYVLVGDQILIVDPHSLEIVAIIEA